MQPLPTLQCSYGPSLVLLSYLISVLGSHCAVRCALLAHQRDRRLSGWLALAALALGGGGIWAMHFIAMIACRLPVPVRYDMPLTLGSLVVAVAMSGAGLYIVSRDPTRPLQLLAGAGVAGLGVSAMHYMGIAAMRLPAHITFRPLLVVPSAIVAVPPHSPPFSA